MANKETAIPRRLLQVRVSYSPSSLTPSGFTPKIPVPRATRPHTEKAWDSMPVPVSKGTLNIKWEVYSTTSPEGSHLIERVRDSRLR